MSRKQEFKMPYLAIARDGDRDLLYGLNGEFSVVISMQNPVSQFCASAAAYDDYHNLLINIVKLLGDGYILQKQDIFSKALYPYKPSEAYLQDKYNAHFAGRKYVKHSTYLVITRQIKKGAFYVYDKKALRDFHQAIGKVLDVLSAAKTAAYILREEQINKLVRQTLSMNFGGDTITLENIAPNDTELKMGNRSVRSISLVDIDNIDLPPNVSTHVEWNEKDTLKGFPVDFLSFLLKVPGCDEILYNQVIEIPNQFMTLKKLELKKKRHSGIPDPANKLCMEDIDQLLTDVARENQLLVNCHFNILVTADSEEIQKAANFIESSLFGMGIVPNKNAYNQLELFRSALPGNAVELKDYDWFLTTCDAALCFFFKESLPKDEPSDFLIRFTDRQGIPIGIDPADLPMRTGRINNRNKFCLGPSGSGKSFFMNALIEQYMGFNMDMVIVDTGHSYSGLCSYYNGKYITYSEKKPITMNPFQITEEEYNIEKKDFLSTLIGLLWKGADGSFTQVERDVIANVIGAYYSHYFTLPAKGPLNFNSFYEFSVKKIPEIKNEEQIGFDIEEFRYVLKKFYKGGEFEPILNEPADQSLFTEKFIVFEIDNVKENRVLFPIVTLIIMDVFIQKMRFRQDRRKCLVVEEAWKAIASPLMAGYLLYLYKTVRKFWGEAIVVTQELGDIIGNAVVKDSIINNSDTIILLDQTKFKDNYKEIAALLSINETERKKIFTINQLDNKEGRDFFKEFYIGRGGVGEVYGNEVAKEQYLTYSTEKPEKSAVEIYTKNHHSYTAGLDAFMLDMKKSGLSLGEFVKKINMKKSILFIALSFWLLTCRAQEVVVDPTTSAAIAVNSAVINGQLKTTNNNLSLIQKGQLAITGQLVIVNNMQSKIYAGLTQVASVINNLTSIKEIGQCGSDIISDVQQSLILAKSDPVLLLFAEQGARDFETRAVTLGADVSAFVLKGGGNSLMDAGERGKLLNHIETEMQILRGIAYGMQRAMYWAKINGIWASLNPWAEWKNRDVQIANDVVNNAKYLKQ